MLSDRLGFVVFVGLTFWYIRKILDYTHLSFAGVKHDNKAAVQLLIKAKCVQILYTKYNLVNDKTDIGGQDVDHRLRCITSPEAINLCPMFMPYKYIYNFNPENIEYGALVLFFQERSSSAAVHFCTRSISMENSFISDVFTGDCQQNWI